MKNHLTMMGLSIAICTFLVAQGSIAQRPAPAKNTAAYAVDQQDTSRRDTSRHKMHKKWKKDKDTSWQRRDTSSMRTENR